MRLRHTIVAAIAVSLATAAHPWAQHGEHEMSAAAAPPGGNADCAEGGHKALAIIEAATARLDADGTGSEGLRAAVAELQRAVGAAQAELFTCRAAVPAASAVSAPPATMAGMDHSKMNMGAPASGAKPAAPGAKPGGAMAGMDNSKMNMGAPASGAKPAASGAKPGGATAGMDHSKMNMRAPASSAKPAAPGAKPGGATAGMDHSKMNMGAPASSAKPAAPGPKPGGAMAGMDHSKMNMGGGRSTPGAMPMAAAGEEAKLPVMTAQRIADPACAANVGQATAPKAVFERKVYYFCSTAARDEFRKAPAAYLEKHPR